MSATPEQIEAIARAYCRNLGLDPDGTVDLRDGPVENWRLHLGDAHAEVAKHLLRLAVLEVLGD